MRRRFLRLAAWNIAANVTVPLTGLVDTAMLGHLPDIRFLAGVALAGVIFDYVYWTFGFLRMATTGTTAQAVGRGDAVAAHRVLQRSLLLAAGAGVVLLALRAPLGDLALALLAGTSQVEEAARAYYDARILGAPATLAGFVFIGWFLGREESREVLWATAAANACNVVLNYVFIVRLDLAARGAGLATMLSQYLLLGVCVVLYLRRTEGIGWRLGTLFEADAWKRMFALQRDILLRTLLLTSTFAAFTNLSAVFGTAVLAANTLLLRLLTLTAYIVDGAAFATESLAGVFHGAGDAVRLRRLLRLALGLGLTTGVAFAAVIVAVPGPSLGLLTSHQDIVAVAAGYRGWLLPTLLFGSLAYIYDGYFLGLTAGGTLRRSMALSTLAVFAPIAAIAWWARAPHLLWAALALFMAARTASLAWAARRPACRGDAGEGAP